MINNKESYTFKKYISIKKTILWGSFIIYIFLLFGAYLSIKIFYSSYSAYPLAAILITLILLMFLYRSGIKADREMLEIKKHNYYTWGIGAGAELVVKKSLMKLSDNYRIISDFQTGKWNIDHICIGPTGIFAIEVKAHRGLIYYTENKLKRDTQDISNFLGQAKAESLFLNHLIKEKLNKEHFVIPVLVFPNGKIDTSICHKIENVWVGGRGFERWVIENCKNTLSSEEIEEICNVLKQNNI